MNSFDEKEYSEKFDLKIWIKLLADIKKYKWTGVVLAVAMIMLAVNDVLFPLFTRYAINNFVEQQNLSSLTPFIALYIGLIVLQSIIVFFFIHNSGKIETGVVYDLRKAGFKRLQELSFSYYDNTAVGWIMTRISSDAQRIGDVIAWSAVDIVWGMAFLVAIIFSMLMLNVKLTLIVLCIVPPLAFVSVFFQKIIFESQRKVRKINSKITGAVSEGISGAKTTKTLRREELNLEEFKGMTLEMKAMSIRSTILSAIFYPVVLSISSVAIGAVVWQGGVEIMVGGLDIATLAVFIAYGTQMFDPIQQLARGFTELQAAQASAERLYSIMGTEIEVSDSEEIVAKYGDALNPKTENWEEIKGDITYDNVSFQYKTGEKVLENFTLHIKAGQKIALVGETGAGKTTIVNLACRFYEPTGGKVLIDGVDYKERAQIWLQSQLGYVLQTPHLFSGTVMENIRYSRLEATDEEVIAAARAVNAYDFVMKLEKGFDTDVGEGGNRLSAGERQLISFARAILKEPRIFILDEATSSIDTETEQVIQRAVDKLLQNRTSLIIAHRLSTIRSCDRILVIENGIIIEDGNHEQLMKRKGHYYELYTNQFNREEVSRVLDNAV